MKMMMVMRMNGAKKKRKEKKLVLRVYLRCFVKENLYFGKKTAINTRKRGEGVKTRWLV